ncbi:MAG: IMP cyclohydrolase [Candidatus Hydrogenedentes bacterium]|nr:IMP cyclohydrolase [Candidatus Hydrogenedentota bacterium]
MLKIKRAIMSCSDKSGLLDLARLLSDFGVEIISTAGTLHTLQEAGIAATSIADFTGVPELLDGRVKSLHPKVHAGLLGVRDNKLHVEQMQGSGFPWIDLVVANLAPFETLIGQTGMTLDAAIDMVDIGGAAMIRSAAKNFRYVTVVVNPERYTTVMHELRAHEGAVSFETRFRLAQEAFACTANYDRIIVDYLRKMEPQGR